jgi:arylsulfatase A-like enzyme
VLACASIACGDRPANSPSRNPNIVVIVTDDQAHQMLQYMQHTQKLMVEQGTSFDNFFINDPICCPSRVTILLGQYRHNHQLEVHETGCGHRFYSQGMHKRALGRRVQDAGYRTGFVGKYLNSHHRYVRAASVEKAGEELLDGWDDYRISLRPRYRGFVLHENGEIVFYPPSPENYQTDVLGRLSTRFIRASADAGKPFFLFVSTDAPHAPTTPAPRHRSLFAETRAPRGPSFNDPDVSGQPGLQESPPLRPKQIASIDATYRRTLQSLQAVDELVLAVVEELERLGQLDDTYLFFASDNGLHFGEHRIAWGKGTPYEEAVRVPLVIRGPGVAKNQVRSEITSNVDILPTVLDILGQQPDERIDGRSLRPLFGPKVEGAEWRRAIALESRHEARNQGVPAFGALRSERYKWIEYENGERALYDLANDPHELTNVYGTENAALGEVLATWLRDLLVCHGAMCERIENEDRLATWSAARDENLEGEVDSTRLRNVEESGDRREVDENRNQDELGPRPLRRREPDDTEQSGDQDQHTVMVHPLHRLVRFVEGVAKDVVELDCIVAQEMAGVIADVAEGVPRVGSVLGVPVELPVEVASTTEPRLDLRALPGVVTDDLLVVDGLARIESEVVPDGQGRASIGADREQPVVAGVVSGDPGEHRHAEREHERERHHEGAAVATSGEPPDGNQSDQGNGDGFRETREAQQQSARSGQCNAAAARGGEEGAEEAE